METILITGGAGFIGSELVLKILEKFPNVKIRVLDILSTQIHGIDPSKTSPTYNKIKNKVTFLKGDIRDRTTLKAALDGVTQIVHLVAETGTGQSMYDIEKHTDVNIRGTAILMEEVSKIKDNIKRIIVASSRAVYGEGLYFCPQHGAQNPSERASERLALGQFEHFCPTCETELQPQATSEENPPNPQSIYGISKLTQEKIILIACRALGIDAFSLRIQNVYGPGQSLLNPYTGILSIFSARARANRTITIFEDGFESRDFVNINDVVQAFLLCLNTNMRGQHIFNIGQGSRFSVIEVVNLITRFFNSESIVTVTGEYRVGDIRHNYANISKIQSMLGYKPTVDFKEGLQSFLEWVQKQDCNYDGYENSLLELRNRGLLK